MKSNDTLLRALATGAVLALAAAAPAQAQTTNNDDWRFAVQLYGWFPSLSGKTNFPTTGGGTNVNVNADDYIGNLNGAFMGTFVVQKGAWGALADWLYADVSGSKTATRSFSLGGNPLPGGATGDLNLDIKSNLLTLAGSYAPIQKPEYNLSVLLGARLLDLQQTLTYTINGNLGSISLPGRSGAAEVSFNNWDAIVGVRGRAQFGEGGRWFVPYYFDIGTGNSTSTWQALVGIGYSFGWGDVLLDWRYLDYNFESSSPIESLTLNGPAIGVVFRW